VAKNSRLGIISPSPLIHAFRGHRSQLATASDRNQTRIDASNANGKGRLRAPSITYASRRPTQ